MNEDHTARLLREQLDAELAQVRTTPRARHDLHAALAAADVPPTGRPGHGRAGRLASGSTTGILLAAAAVTLIAMVPAVLVDGSSPPAVPPLPTTGAPAGVPGPRRPATTPPTSDPRSDPTVRASATAAPAPSPTPSRATELPRPPAQERTSPRGLALRLEATSVRVGIPVSPTVHWDVGASLDLRTASAIPPVPTGTVPPARTIVSVTWGDGATTSAALPCPDQPDAQVEVPAHSYRTPGRYRLRVTTSGGCDLDVPALLQIVTVTR